MKTRLKLTALGVLASLSVSHGANAEEITIATVNSAGMHHYARACFSMGRVNRKLD